MARKKTPPVNPMVLHHFKQATGDAIVAEYMRGHSMVSISRMEGMPPVKVIYHWMERNTFFRNRMKEARKLRAIYFEDQALAEAEEAAEHNVQSKRLKVDTYKWAAGVNDPETYGSRTKVVGDPNQPVAFLIDTGIRRESDVPALTDKTEGEE